MIRLRFADPDRYALAATLARAWGATLEPTSQQIEATGPLLALLERMANGTVAILPIRGADQDTWLIAGANRRDLETALNGVSRFVVPSYAEYEASYPVLRAFEPTEDPLGRLGNQIYPAGYYQLRSPSAHAQIILARMARWLALDAARPSLQATRPPSYRDLYDGFQAALSAGMWERANDLLDQIRRYGLATTENLMFLEVQWLAQQRRWQELWQRADYRDLARLQSPRAVRAALLAAFHQSELLPLEQAQQWDAALTLFRRSRGMLGRLIEGTPDLTYGPALRTFAYREAAAGDRDALARLDELAQDDETRQVLTAIAALLPPPDPLLVAAPVAPPALTASQAFRLALSEGDYAAALAAAQAITQADERVRALLDGAFLSGEPAHAELALLEFWNLPEPEQASLRQNPRVARSIAMLEATVTPLAPVIPASDPSAAPINDWLAWLSLAATDENDPRLARSLPIVASVDDSYWTAERITELAERLADLATSGATLNRPHLRDAIRRLRDHLLQDPEFPRDDAAYGEVYEALYAITFEQRELNEATSLVLLRLAEARLRHSPNTMTSIAGHLQAWLSEPILALEAVAQEALDVMAAYGVQGPTLAPWYRRWAETVLAAPRQLDRLTLESWLLFGEWVQPGPDLLDTLRQRLNRSAPRTEDPIAALPTGYRIGIYILSPDRVGRVVELLKRRNPDLDMIVCADKVLTEQARNLAQTADMVVIVTGCVKHALTYGIGPYLRDPVYPASVGSTSILRAIEERAARGAYTKADSR
ncbi:protein DpdD [Candidatus Viridilinea mediisalina]|uniref:Uncharacterized protein n=1 Tax=Candidatus Viridilinea mediisalina TaxID=2024553 RepID=A0A2A6RHR2_9CHLR|nr:protein DpdD [Candidatus Viridilinea mediisalina]PDW02617.1 hypothetical protein CJ255_13090 [Candidatus Viridilinea mediisalina]